MSLKRSNLRQYPKMKAKPRVQMVFISSWEISDIKCTNQIKWRHLLQRYFNHINSHVSRLMKANNKLFKSLRLFFPYVFITKTKKLT